MLSNLILSLAISFAVGLNGITKNENNNFNNNNNVNNVNNTINYKIATSESETSSEVSYPIYNDVEYTITLSAYQLNNYTFENLFSYISNDILVNETGIGDFFSQIQYNYHLYDNPYEGDGNSSFIYNEDNYIDLIYDVELYNSANATNIEKNYIFYYNPSTGHEEFTSDARLDAITLNIYNTIKSLIQADIQSNEQTGTMGDNIIDAITSGLGLIGDLAREFLTGFSTLFWDATANNNAGALTPFGQFALVMLGVAITMAVISLVLALIKGNTGA